MMKFIDWFHINNFSNLCFRAVKKLNRDKTDNNNQLEMYKIIKNREDPEFFRNYFESKPLSENWILRAVSLVA
jgi:hypothetical protein